MLEHLESLSVFCGLNEGDLESIALFSYEREYHDGEIVISEDSKDGFDLFLLVKGGVEVVTHGADSNNVTDEVVISKQDKDIFGEIGWLFREKRTATVRSYGKSTIIRVDGDNLRLYLSENPKAGYEFMTYMSQHLARTVTATSNLLKQVLWVNGI